MHPCLNHHHHLLGDPKTTTARLNPSQITHSGQCRGQQWLLEVVHYIEPAPERPQCPNAVLSSPTRRRETFWYLGVYTVVQEKTSRLILGSKTKSFQAWTRAYPCLKKHHHLWGDDYNYTLKPFADINRSLRSIKQTTIASEQQMHWLFGKKGCSQLWERKRTLFPFSTLFQRAAHNTWPFCSSCALVSILVSVPSCHTGDWGLNLWLWSLQARHFFESFLCSP